MTARFATTPFGGARMSASIFRKQQHIERQRTSLRDGGNDTGRAEKWQLIRALSEARAVYALSDRAITVLEALLSFHPERELDGSNPIIVFPSNDELSMRCRGMADATLRRHIASLVQAGLIMRRDSPNGKRYCRRDAHGEVETAFGFDLSPLALCATEIHAEAEKMRAYARGCQKLRGEITIHIRDVAKILDAARAEKRRGDWETLELALAPLTRRLSRLASKEVLEARLAELVSLRAKVENAYVETLEEIELSGNDSNSERHYQNSNPEPLFETSSQKELNEERSAQTNLKQRPPVTLAYLLSVCPSLASYARDGVDTWQQVLTTAQLVRSMLGVSPDAWRRACEAMGDLTAAVTIAAMLEKAETIRSPGGYLRALTERAESGLFSVRPMLAALESPDGGGRQGTT